MHAFQVPPLLWLEPRILLQPDIAKTNRRALAHSLGLNSATELDVQKLACTIAKEPALLACTAAAFEQRLHACADIFDATRACVIEAVLAHPQLLSQHPDDIRMQLHALAEQSSMPQSAWAHVLLAKPSLLATPPELLTGRIKHLVHACNPSKEGCMHDPVEILEILAQGGSPEVLAVSECFLDKRCKELGQLLHITPAHATLMLVSSGCGRPMEGGEGALPLALPMPANATQPCQCLC